MKVITEEVLDAKIEVAEKMLKSGCIYDIRSLKGYLQEIDTLTPKETDLILAAEKYAEIYDGDDRQDVKTDVLNAFYHGADFQRKQKSDTLTFLKLRVMREKPEVPANKMSVYVLVYSIGMSVPRISRFDLHNGFYADARKNGVGLLVVAVK